jgi:hypothetical protein
MTPKEKAWEIFYKFKTIPDKWKDEKVFQNYYAKQCALIAVDEVISNNASIYSQKYWQEVKKEIEKL